MKKEAILIIFLLLMGLFFLWNKWQKMNAASYGKKVAFAQNAQLKFPDFNMYYLGVSESVVPGGSFPPISFTHYNFLLKSADGETKELAWSSGLGEIAPQKFEFKGGNYSLEMRLSESLGQLESNELVINKR